MARRLLFSIESPLGYRVSLARDRWKEITKYKHPALAGRQDAVRACLQAPKLIRESAKDAEVHLYYAPAEQRNLCVVVAPENEAERFVVTAYFTKNIKKGNDLWTS